MAEEIKLSNSTTIYLDILFSFLLNQICMYNMAFLVVEFSRQGYKIRMGLG